jgi:O-antigen ligase
VDPAKAAANLAFFYIPFALLFLLLREVRWTTELLLRCLAIAVVLAVVFAGIGFVEYQRKALFLNPKVVAANEFDNYFRVNSLFFDPNIYGRFLIVVMLLVTGWLLWAREKREVLAGAVLLLVLWGALVVTFSQSSFASLLVGLAVLGALRWNARRALAISAAALVVGIAVIALAPGLVKVNLGSSKSAQKSTSGRYDLISGGVGLWRAKPVFGQGSGSFPRAYRRAEKVSAERATSASHTIPITIAAEQGLLGLIAYLALLAAALARLGHNARYAAERAAVLAAFVALVAHTMMYAAFLEDPLTWVLLGAGSAMAGWTTSRVRDRHAAAA